MKSRIALSVLILGIMGLLSCAKQDVPESKTFTSADLEKVLTNKPLNVHLVDVRTPEEYAVGHIPGAINIPVDTIAANFPTQAKTDEIIVYCRSGRRSAQAKTILQGAGYTDVVDFGAVANWKGKLVTGDKPE